MTKMWPLSSALQGEGHTIAGKTIYRESGIPMTYINNLVKYICQDSDGRRVRLKQRNKSKITRNSNFE